MVDEVALFQIQPLPSIVRTRSDTIREQNALIVSQLKILADGYRSTNDKWRALTYDKAIKQIQRVTEPITSRQQVLALSGIGAKLADKICEIMATGKLRKAEKMADDSLVQTLNLFTNVWGVGPATARQWYDAGLRTLADVKAKAKLTSAQQIGLAHYDDLLEKMPRTEAARISAVVVRTARELLPGAICTTCGSYRRGAAQCGDVDILITHADGESHAHILHKLVEALEQQHFLTDHLVKSADDDTHRKYMGVCRLTDVSGAKVRVPDLSV